MDLLCCLPKSPCTKSVGSLGQIPPREPWLGEFRELEHSSNPRSTKVVPNKVPATIAIVEPMNSCRMVVLFSSPAHSSGVWVQTGHSWTTHFGGPIWSNHFEPYQHGEQGIKWYQVSFDRTSHHSISCHKHQRLNGCCLRNITKSCSVPKGAFLDANCFNSNSFEIWWKGVHPASQFLSIPIPTAGLGSFSPSCKLRAGFEITFGRGAVVRVDKFGPPWMDAFLGCKKKTMWNTVHIYHTSSSFMDQMLSDMILTCHWSLIVFNVCISYINMIQYACTRIRFHLISM